MSSNKICINTEILRKLKESDGVYVSGESLSEALGVSRTAVWKHIKELRDKGYSIDSSSKKGYKITNWKNMLNEYEIQSSLETRILGSKVKYFNTIESTNSYAKEMASNGCVEGTVVIADSQTSGRGRLGREWHSPGGKGIWMSVVLRPIIDPEDVQIITLAASVAVAKVLERVCGIKVGIKWPNDIVVEGKKLCGILTEMSSEVGSVDFIVLGIGINVNHDQKDFPVELKDLATSVKLHLCRQDMDESMKSNCEIIDRAPIIREFLMEFERIYLNLNDEKEYNSAAMDIITQWKKYSATLGKKVKVMMRNIEYLGEAVDITSDGRLVVKCDDGEIKEILSGEVSVRGMLGYAPS